jgi:putative flippase GtrA
VINPNLEGDVVANNARAAQSGRQNRHQFLLFVLMSGMAALVSFLSRILFSHWTSYTAAIILAFLCGISTAFVPNRLFVFREAVNGLHHQMFWFSVVNLFALAQTIMVSLLLAEIVFPRMGMTWHA